jgi:hypothetical protein
LDALRHYCVRLARLRSNFLDPDAVDEGYFKVEEAMPVEQLAPLRGTFCPMEEGPMLQSAFAIVRYYREAAAPLAQQHAIPYPAKLERLMVERLEKVRAVQDGARLS